VDRDGYAILVVPETMRWSDGTPVGGSTPDWEDAFGHKYFRGVGSTLARQFTATLGVQARYDKPGTIARMAMHAVSEVDLAEAVAVGAEAVRRVLGGESGAMVAILRESTEPYRVTYRTAPLDRIANVERRLPDEMIDPSGHDVTTAFTTWAMPLLGAPLPIYEVLD
jgi:6-phosphofructokinase 1